MQVSQATKSAHQLLILTFIFLILKFNLHIFILFIMFNNLIFFKLTIYVIFLIIKQYGLSASMTPALPAYIFGILFQFVFCDLKLEAFVIIKIGKSTREHEFIILEIISGNSLKAGAQTFSPGATLWCSKLNVCRWCWCLPIQPQLLFLKHQPRMAQALFQHEQLRRSCCRNYYKQPYDRKSENLEEMVRLLKT